MLHNHLRISRLRKGYRISFLFNPTSFSPTRTAEHLIGAARSLGIDLTRVDAQSPADLAGAFAKMSQAGVVAALVDPQPPWTNAATFIAHFRAWHQIPYWFGFVFIAAWVALNTIIDENTVRHIIPQLKQAGARGIVEYPLSKIIA